ncbi:MAG: hypothetical protein HYT87_14830 [Nitrospirae bacterium]|nr:hypothetical protein [Nitrospirota bacterium]
MNKNSKDDKTKRARMPFPFPMLGGSQSGVSDLEELYVDALAEGGMCEAPEQDRTVEMLSIGGTTVVRRVGRRSRVIVPSAPLHGRRDEESWEPYIEVDLA